MFKELKAIIFEELKESIKEIGIMPKSRNLPMTTREPISDAKARELEWGAIAFSERGPVPSTNSSVQLSHSFVDMTP